MDKKKIIAVSLAATVLTGVGIMINKRNDKIDFDEIIIDGVPEKKDNSIRIMSFNLRYCDDKAGSVDDRSRISCAIIKQYEPDSLGVQEATGRWLDILDTALGDKYAYIGQARDTGGYKSERSAVFYLKDKYKLIDEGTIWLSETPEVKYTKSFDSNCFRVASWAVLENKKTGERYTHLNTHLDHVLEETRVCQIEVFIRKLAELQKNGSVFCTGDFNAEETSRVYARMAEVTDDARATASQSDSGITFHDYGKALKAGNLGGIIDYIFVPKGAKVERFKIIRNTFGGMYPSDHFPIIADIITEEDIK